MPARSKLRPRIGKKAGQRVRIKRQESVHIPRDRDQFELELNGRKHASGSVIDFPIVRDQAFLLWMINLGCIDLNPWYARCDGVLRP